MDIEELSKSQIVLLVLLLSFVTSMATGIVTVSLMDQAPTSVAQTVNRVIQQTINEVKEPSQAAAAAVPAKTTNPAPDAVAAAIQKASSSVVRLYAADQTTFLGMGVVLEAGGIIAADMGSVGTASGVSITRADGSLVSGAVITRDSNDGIVLVAAATSTSATSTLAWSPITLAPSAPLLGESVIEIAGESDPSVARGIVSSITRPLDGVPVLVKTDILGDNVLYGSPLIDTQGNLVGMSTAVSRTVSGSAYLSAAAIRTDIAAQSR